MTDWELAIEFPLGVVAEQLRRVEEGLRVVSASAIGASRDTDGAVARRRIEARVESIRSTLHVISRLVTDLESDLQPEDTPREGSDDHRDVITQARRRDRDD